MIESVTKSLGVVKDITQQFYKELLLFILICLLIILIVFVVQQYYWSIENAAVLVKRPIAGSSASASLHRGSPLLELVSDEDRTSNAGGIFIKNIETVQTNGPVDFSVSFAMFADNITSAQEITTLFSIGGKDFSVKMDMFRGELIVGTRILYDYEDRKTGESLRQTYQEVRLPYEKNQNYIKMQTWNYLTISVSGRSIDIYVNGILAQYFLLKNVPLIQAGGEWNMFPGNTPFHGLVSDVRFITQSISRTDAKILYHLFSGAPETPFWWFFWFPVGKSPAL